MKKRLELKAILIMAKLNYARTKLQDFQIDYEEWDNEQGAREIRVDLHEDDNARALEIFEVEANIEDVDYLIFWE